MKPDLTDDLTSFNSHRRFQTTLGARGKAVIITISLAAVWLWKVPVSAAASTPALRFTGQALNGTAINATRGFSFDVTDPLGVIVTDLGVFDSGANGLVQSHDVGLWDSAGTLLASATVPSGSGAPLDVNNLFRVVAITPIFLSAGANYAVGAVFAQFSGDFQAKNWSTLATAPGIAYDQSRYANNGVATLTFPTSTDPASGYPGGSFQVISAPEPSAWALLAACTASLLALRRRRRTGGV